MKIPRYTIDTLHEQFPNDDACLDFMFAQQYGKLLLVPSVVWLILATTGSVIVSVMPVMTVATS